LHLWEVWLVDSWFFCMIPKGGEFTPRRPAFPPSQSWSIFRQNATIGCRGDDAHYKGPLSEVFSLFFRPRLGGDLTRGQGQDMGAGPLFESPASFPPPPFPLSGGSQKAVTVVKQRRATSSDKFFFPLLPFEAPTALQKPIGFRQKFYFWAGSRPRLYCVTRFMQERG